MVLEHVVHRLSRGHTVKRFILERQKLPIGTNPSCVKLLRFGSRKRSHGQGGNNIEASHSGALGREELEFRHRTSNRKKALTRQVYLTVVEEFLTVTVDKSVSFRMHFGWRYFGVEGHLSLNLFILHLPVLIFDEEYRQLVYDVVSAIAAGAVKTKCLRPFHPAQER